MSPSLRRKLWRALLGTSGGITIFVFVFCAVFSRTIPPAQSGAQSGALAVIGVEPLLGTGADGWQYGRLWTTSWWADIAVLLVLAAVTAIVDRAAQIDALHKSGAHLSLEHADAKATKDAVYAALASAWETLGLALILAALLLCAILPPVSLMAFSQFVCVLVLVLGRCVARGGGGADSAAADGFGSDGGASGDGAGPNGTAARRWRCTLLSFSRAVTDHCTVLVMGVMFLLHYTSQFPYVASLLSEYWPAPTALALTLSDVGISELNADPESSALSISGVHLFLQAILFCGCSLFCRQTAAAELGAAPSAAAAAAGAAAAAASVTAASATAAAAIATAPVAVVQLKRRGGSTHSLRRLARWASVVVFEFVLPPLTPMLTFAVAVLVATRDASGAGLLLLAAVCVTVGFFGSVGLNHLWVLSLAWGIALVALNYMFQFDLFVPGGAAWDLVCARGVADAACATNATAAWRWIGLNRVFASPNGTRALPTLTTIHLGEPDGGALYWGALRDLAALLAWPIALAAAALLQGWSVPRRGSAAAARARVRAARRRTRSAGGIRSTSFAASLRGARHAAPLGALGAAAAGGIESEATISRAVAAATEGIASIVDVLLFRLIGVILVASAIWHQNAISLVYLAVVGLWLFLWAFQGKEKHGCCAGGRAGQLPGTCARCCDAAKASEVMAVIVPMVLAVSVPVQYALTIGVLILFTVTFCANPANDLTRPPSYIIM